MSSIDNYIWVFVVLGVWEAGWKAWGLWLAARNKQPVWFGAIFVINTVGILPILYIYVFSKRKK